MSGPRRHGSRRTAASCLFVLLVLAFALVRGTAASASKADAQARHARHAHHATGLGKAVGTVGKQLGKTVDSLLDGVGGLLGKPAHTQHGRPTSTPTTRPTPTAPTSAPATSTAPRPEPSTSAPHRPASSSSPARPPASGAVQPPANSAPAQQQTHRGTRTASPVTATSRASGTSGPSGSSSPRSAPSSQRSTLGALADHTGQIPGLDVTTALSALMLAMMLGIGLIVYRAGYRGERAH